MIADEDSLYDPRDFNDLLLLGLKGAISEVELHHIRARMACGRLNKALRGELEISLPIGLEHDFLSGEIRLAVDQSVRHRIERVFDLFRQLRTIRAVLRHLRTEGLEMPAKHFNQVGGAGIKWRAPSYDARYAIITSPVYAGAYSYGRRQRQCDHLTRTYHYRKQGRDELIVFIADHHPGYITLDEYEENQRTLANNRNLFPGNQGAARSGEALLQGIIYCQHCGDKMRVRYRRSAAYYTCDSAHQHHDAPICNRASAQRVDALVSELFLSALNEGTLERSLTFDELLQKEVAEQKRGWKEKMERSEYQADLARRRYEMVAPANRLVAQALETDWGERLRMVEATRKEHEVRSRSRRPLHSPLAQMQEMIEHLQEHWEHGFLRQEDKKESVRCLIEQVF